MVEWKEDSTPWKQAAADEDRPRVNHTQSRGVGAQDREQTSCGLRTRVLLRSRRLTVSYLSIHIRLSSHSDQHN